ncbi:hypothetical protein N0V83_009612 [Neocucurbitaria cava]|uniref:Uncharacterized protein n=1 Tax=Neocucurbitaria cava TaxID=798079 RepID=A0A9W9CHQ3_9PLEO|nr:hypothetical protein N0V83_009612 [Neocucurbitaria cava]
MDAFMVAELDNAVNVVWGVPDPNDKTAEIDVNTSRIEKLREIEVSLGAMELTGCTMLAIISRKGVYMSHWWESISFAPDLEDYGPVPDDPVEIKELKDNIFTNTLLKGIHNGIKKKGDSIQASVRLGATDLNDEHIQAYLIRPSNDYTEGSGYREEWDKIKQAVVRYLPRLGESNRWREITYDPVPDDDNRVEVLEHTVRGRVLFKYDPNHRLEGARPIHRNMFWVEDTEIHMDEW